MLKRSTSVHQTVVEDDFLLVVGEIVPSIRRRRMVTYYSELVICKQEQYIETHCAALLTAWQRIEELRW